MVAHKLKIPGNNVASAMIKCIVQSLSLAFYCSHDTFDNVNLPTLVGTTGTRSNITKPVPKQRKSHTPDVHYKHVQYIQGTKVCCIPTYQKKNIYM